MGLPQVEVPPVKVPVAALVAVSVPEQVLPPLAVRLPVQLMLLRVDPPVAAKTQLTVMPLVKDPVEQFVPE